MFSFIIPWKNFLIKKKIFLIHVMNVLEFIESDFSSGDLSCLLFFTNIKHEDIE